PIRSSGQRPTGFGARFWSPKRSKPAVSTAKIARQTQRSAPDTCSAEQSRQPALGDGGETRDLGPCEPAWQPTRRRHHVGLADGVIDGLILVLLAVELDEGPHIRT